MYIPKMVCVSDRVELVVEHTGVIVEMTSDNGHKIKVSSDVFQCPMCGTEVALMAQAAIVEGWQAEYGNVPAQVTASFAH